MLRIPVTESEKSLILAVAIAVEGEFANWARDVLLREAAKYKNTKGRQAALPKNKRKVGAASLN